jgi:PAS domain S-box-containing protein
VTDDPPRDALSLTTPMIQQSLLGQAVDSADVLVFVADDEMRYIAVNQRACEVLGYTREELLRMTVEDVAADVDAHAQYQEMITARSRRGVSSIRRKDGSILEFRYTATEARVSGLPYYVSIGVVDPDTAESAVRA